MRARRWLVLGAALVAATTVAGAARAVGPWPGLASAVNDSTGFRYSVHMAAGKTTLTATRDGRVARSATFPGLFGVPAVTSTGAPGGLSPSGRLLVLAQPPNYQGLRKQSRFLLVATPRLSVVRTLELPGEFGFDALSPDGGTLYLIQHISSDDLVRYVVRAYELNKRRLLATPIVDKRSPDEAMRGYPVARATSAGGAWVYTLYTHLGAKGPEGVFVHALNAAGRYALCIDLPDWPSGVNIWQARLEISGQAVVVRVGRRQVATIDMNTLRAV
jgi:hypothetical protein